ncbi:hypothetical protein BJ508DRAFT_333973 [Ascobolus immersus RN42]|uniref:Uncharacterized protein n=1 Tax=Ascobolus immersus RN42 TaxID=1160509 RepID=A0A3N4HN60_ASCIM|nr:hypothetical protein BJ508DRAFT_333973 [Ascobolus immersus RN42]
MVKGDALVFFVSCHGIRVLDGEEYVYKLVFSHRHQVYLTPSELFDVIAKYGPRGTLILIVINSCHSGGFKDAMLGLEKPGSRLRPKVVIFAGCSKDEEIFSVKRSNSDKYRGGVFVHRLVSSIYAHNSVHIESPNIPLHSANSAAEYKPITSSAVNHVPAFKLPPLSLQSFAEEVMTEVDKLAIDRQRPEVGTSRDGLFVYQAMHPVCVPDWRVTLSINKTTPPNPEVQISESEETLGDDEDSDAPPIPERKLNGSKDDGLWRAQQEVTLQPVLAKTWSTAATPQLSPTPQLSSSASQLSSSASQPSSSASQHSSPPLLSSPQQPVWPASPEPAGSPTPCSSTSSPCSSTSSPRSTPSAPPPSSEEPLKSPPSPVDNAPTLDALSLGPNFKDCVISSLLGATFDNDPDDDGTSSGEEVQEEEEEVQEEEQEEEQEEGQWQDAEVRVSVLARIQPAVRVAGRRRVQRRRGHGPKGQATCCEKPRVLLPERQAPIKSPHGRLFFLSFTATDDAKSDAWMGHDALLLHHVYARQTHWEAHYASYDLTLHALNKHGPPHAPRLVLPPPALENQFVISNARRLKHQFLKAFEVCLQALDKETSDACVVSVNCHGETSDDGKLYRIVVSAKHEVFIYASELFSIIRKHEKSNTSLVLILNTCHSGMANRNLEEMRRLGVLHPYAQTPPSTPVVVLMKRRYQSSAQEAVTTEMYCLFTTWIGHDALPLRHLYGRVPTDVLRGALHLR